jgi:hypothetical protein
MKFDPNASGLLRVAESDVLEEHQTQTLTMKTGGYSYTYVTNRSTKKVNFDNLRIVHLQGQVRARYDYYSYGLMWSQPVNPYCTYNNTMRW